jgi:hypothetical protein|eukprot:30017-Pelagococcus_subviridis.AAC.9
MPLYRGVVPAAAAPWSCSRTFAVSSGIVHASAKHDANALAARFDTKFGLGPSEGGGDIASDGARVVPCASGFCFVNATTGSLRVARTSARPVKDVAQSVDARKRARASAVATAREHDIHHAAERRRCRARGARIPRRRDPVAARAEIRNARI